MGDNHLKTANMKQTIEADSVNDTLIWKARRLFGTLDEFNVRAFCGLSSSVKVHTLWTWAYIALR